MAVKIDELELEIKHTGKDAADDIDKLTAALGRLKDAVKNVPADAFKKAVGGMSGNKDEGVQAVEKRWVKARQAVDDYAKAVDKARQIDAKRLTQGRSVPDKQDPTLNADNSAKMAEQATTKYASSVRNLGLAMRKTASLGSGLLRVFGRATVSGLSFGRAIFGIFPPSFMDRVKKTAAMIKKLSGQFARVASIKAIRKAISWVTKGIKEGVDAMYQWSASVDGVFAASMDRIAASSNYLKSALGTTVSPLINAVAPVVEYLTDRFVDLLNAIQQVFAALTGQGFWTKAERGVSQYADSLGGAADAAKKLNVQLMDFDEINNITTPNDGAGGGGGGNNGGLNTSYVESSLPDWAQAIKDAVDKGDWAGAGSALGNKINSVVRGIDSYSLGKELAAKINNGLSFVNGFLTSTNFYEIGRKIALYLNGAIKGADWALVGQTVANKANALINTALGLAKNFNFTGAGTAIGTAIGNWLKTVKWENLGKLWSSAAHGIVDFISAAVNTIKPTDITRAIEDFLTGLTSKGGLGKKIGKTVKTILTKKIPWKTLGKGANKLISSFLGMIKSIFQEITASDIAKAVEDAMDGLDLPQLGTELGEAVAEIINDIPFGAIGSVIGDIGEAIANFLIAAIKKIKWVDVVKGIGSGLANAGWTGMLVYAPKVAKKIAPFIIKVFGHSSVAESAATGTSNALNSTTFSSKLKASGGLTTFGSVLSGAMVGALAVSFANDFSQWFDEEVLGPKGVATVMGAKANIGDKGGKYDPSKLDYGDLTKYFNGYGEASAKEMGNGWAKGLADWVKKPNESYDAWLKRITKGGSVTGGTTEQGRKGGVALGKGMTEGIADKNSGIPNTKSNIIKILNDDKAYKNAGQAIGESIGTGIKKGLNDYLKKSVLYYKDVTGTTRSQLLGINVATTKAQGGYVESGEYFIAREAGPELVGRIGNRTAVANNDQIVAAVASGVRDANAEEIAVLREQNNLLRTIAAKNTNVSLRPDAAAGRWVKQAQVAYARVTG